MGCGAGNDGVVNDVRGVSFQTASTIESMLDERGMRPFVSRLKMKIKIEIGTVANSLQYTTGGTGKINNVERYLCRHPHNFHPTGLRGAR